MRISLACFLLLFTTCINAQYRVRFILREKTAIPHDSIYIAGSFNNWISSANNKYLLEPYGANEKAIVLNLNRGVIEYKFHRGDWSKEEREYNGDLVNNHVAKITTDTTLTNTVVTWLDEEISDKMVRLSHAESDSAREILLYDIAWVYGVYTFHYNLDSAIFFLQKSLDLQQKEINLTNYRSVPENIRARYVNSRRLLTFLLRSTGNYSKTLQINFENLRLSEGLQDQSLVTNIMHDMMIDYTSMRDFPNVLIYGKKMDSVIKTYHIKDTMLMYEGKNLVSNAYYELKLPDSAFYHLKPVPFLNDSNCVCVANACLLLGNIYTVKGNYDSAFKYYRKAIPFAYSNYAPQLAASAHVGMAKLFQKKKMIDSGLYYARLAYSFFENNSADIKSWGQNTESYMVEAAPLLAELYKEDNQVDSAYKYLKIAVALKDSLYNTDRIRQFQKLTFNEDMRRRETEQKNIQEQQAYKNKVRMISLITGLIVIIIVAVMLYRNNKQKQTANLLLQHQKEEIQRQKEKVESTLSELKSTQAQLIQSEKMASLGELTAGIAHEIQNPLNFVNNFSEVSNELVDEMKDELATGNVQLATEIADDIKQNLEKINHHGKRADAIVKGMLEHSKTSTGIKEPTDINKLVDEYLRLAYHGLRAKDKDFNAEIKTDFDDTIEKINIVPQDIGRVLLNLFNNAFYAVNEKLKAQGSQLAAKSMYVPTVAIVTKKLNDKIQIKVSDNGNGIPQNIVGKIFQPFFTTKPTGQGTGLGLSLAYDIVKAHGGEIKVETREGEGSEFAIRLPYNP